MACSCRGRNKSKYKWVSDDGTAVIIYDTEIQARAKKMRSGGTYTKESNSG